MKLNKFVLAGLLALQTTTVWASRTDALLEQKRVRDAAVADLKKMGRSELQQELETWNYVLSNLQKDISKAKEANPTEDMVKMGAGSLAVAITGLAAKMGGKTVETSLFRLVAIAGKGTRLAGVLVSVLGGAGAAGLVGLSGGTYIFSQIELITLEKELSEAQAKIDILNEVLKS